MGGACRDISKQTFSFFRRHWHWVTRARGGTQLEQTGNGARFRIALKMEEVADDGEG